MAEARNAELEVQIENDPDDVRAYSVYGDWLQQQGDPRGELIALEIAGDDAAARRHRDRHHDYFYGDLALFSAWFTWRHGFIDEARLAAPPGARQSINMVLWHLLRHPSGRFLRRLWVGNNFSALNLHRETRVLGQHAPRTLVELHLGDGGNPLWTNRQDAGSLGALWPRVPRLRRLAVIADRCELGPIDLPEATDVDLDLGWWSATDTDSITGASWPSLERLRVSNGRPSALVTELLGIERSQAPRLAHLSLGNADLAGEQGRSHLAGAAIVRHLRQLDLTDGAMTDADARWLASQRIFRGLECLDVSGNRLGPEGIAAVQGLARTVITERQRGAEGVDLYDY